LPGSREKPHPGSSIIIVTHERELDRMRNRALGALLAFVCLSGCETPPAAGKVENVILVTLDGARTQEVFGGLDLEILRAATKKGAVEETPAYKRYYAPTPRERREKLMPFLWGTLLREHGSIAGNRALGSTAQVTNKHRFSYPGYSELLTGEAHDDKIDSNDKWRNPNPTVLEFLRKELELEREEVAVFASWDTFGWIVEHQIGAITANAGLEPYDHPDPRVRLVSDLQFETPPPWDGVRYDYYTFRFAMAHLARWQPRVLHLAFDETDDWAHDGKYARVLETLERTDGFLRELWTYLESSRRYRGRTALVITVDHGRGNTTTDWTDHGEKVEGAQYIWMAFVSPTSPLRGEWSDCEPVYQNQIAATLCRFLGLDYGKQNPDAGKPIARLFAGADAGNPPPPDAKR
jgi:hypothetical protein